ncbi:hypothetical protein MTR_3g033020 [Medicago truncatula]|uniref:Uncharacterized protein n=1 Tax=Medicago truncatula TaxID=3880 RepID=G7J0V0_MEDTR|nr:hypothetical protein MTR_3g033020 [Medicago truncatula]
MVHPDPDGMGFRNGGEEEVAVTFMMLHGEELGKAGPPQAILACSKPETKPEDTKHQFWLVQKINGIGFPKVLIVFHLQHCKCNMKPYHTNHNFHHHYRDSNVHACP